MPDFFRQQVELAGHAITQALETCLRIVKASETPDLTGYLAMMMLQDAAAASRVVIRDQMPNVAHDICDMLDAMHATGAFQIDITPGKETRCIVTERRR